jgi:uncharacterized protein (DUF952 family)
VQNAFLAQFGFDEDPFASTNAAGEARLDAYFVEPPYFDAVVGDPNIPQSHIVLAPRGGGKTAQKRRLESIAPESGFFCISYDEFDLPSGFGAQAADWDYHVTQICRRMTAGILTFLHEQPSYVQILDKRQKGLLGFYADAFIGPMSAADFQAALRSIKSIPHRVGKVLSEYGGPVAIFVRAVLAKLDINESPSKDELVGGLTLSQSLRYHLDQLASIIRSLDFSSTYVLVDRVDELEATTNDAEKTFNFVKPLLTDLRTLETPGLAFKFFLWDQTGPYVREHVRLDRIPMDVLSWSPEELRRMLSRRLEAYSHRNVSSIAQLACEEATSNWDPIVARLAHGSPREMIVLLRQVIAEQTRTGASGACISVANFWSAVRSFSDDLAAEVAGKYLDDLRRIGASGRITFGIAEVASEIFRISQQMTGSKIQSWQRTGVIAQIGTMPNPGRRPPFLYGPTDLRVAIAMSPNTSPEETLAWNAVICHGCERLVITDRSLPCPSCMAEIQYEEANSVISIATRRGTTSPAAWERTFAGDFGVTVRKILHVTTPRAWGQAQTRGSVKTDSLKTDGCIHCSTAEQVEQTANRLYRKAGTVTVLVIDPARLAAPLKYERLAPDGPEFPHIYGPINLESVVSAIPLHEGPDGYVLPASLRPDR